MLTLGRYLSTVPKKPREVYNLNPGWLVRLHRRADYVFYFDGLQFA